MDIPSFLKKKIYIAYAIGSNNKGKVEYEQPHIINAQTEDIKSLFLKEDIGYVPDYDRLILIPYGEESQFVDEQTLLWVNVEPNAEMSNMDYKIERVGDVIDGNFIIYCNATTPNTKPLYYAYNNTIYQVKVDFNNLIAIVPLNKYLPITKETKVWLTKPDSLDSEKNLIQLISKERLSKSYKLTFQKVN